MQFITIIHFKFMAANVFNLKVVATEQIEDESEALRI